jgi:EAL and modified HD-GYP domain-containing signal transduction protein
LLELADVIKIDVQALSSADVKAQYALLRGYKAELMAEKVETHAQFQFCRDLGFDSFQGYFLCRPNIIHGSPVQTNRLTTFQILSALQDSQLGQAELIQLLSKHDFLGRKFVRLMHQVSPADVKGGLTVSKAVCLAGVEQSKVWLTLICLSARSTKPAELLNMALVRAKMCELLAVASGFTKPDQSYRVGLFSVLDALFDLPMNRIIGVLPLPMNMKQALNGLGGALGDILKCVTSYEQGDWNSVHWADLDMSSIRDAYCASVGWAETLSEQLRALP